MKKLVKYLVALGVLALALTACGPANTSASDQSLSASNKLQRQIFQAKNNIEFQNYNLRQKMSDDKATILWCTFFPATTGQEPFTVPVAGKLTSSSKRPYQGSSYDGNGYSYEVPGPDHMYGSSSEYRYGFDPTRTIYYDFTSLASFCTNTPNVWQKNKTSIVIQTDATLSSLDKAAQAALKAGDARKALLILSKADSSKAGK